MAAKTIPMVAPATSSEAANLWTPAASGSSSTSRCLLCKRPNGGRRGEAERKTSADYALPIPGHFQTIVKTLRLLVVVVVVVVLVQTRLVETRNKVSLNLTH